MATWVTDRPTTSRVPTPSIRVLRWTYRRGDEAVLCVLGLNSDDSAYELRIKPSSDPGDEKAELFDDATDAFEYLASIERELATAGWLLEAFESEHMAR